MFLSGVSGSAVADASALGKVLIPSMVKEGYDKEFSTALLATAATAGRSSRRASPWWFTG